MRRILIGSQDVFSHMYINQEWLRLKPQSHDGSNCLIHTTNPDIFYTSDYQLTSGSGSVGGTIFYNELIPGVPPYLDDDEMSNSSGYTRRNFPFQIPMELDPEDPDVLYAGYGTLRKSISGGTLFKLEPHTISPLDSNRILAMAFSASNPNIIYIATLGYWADATGAVSTSYNSETHAMRLSLFVHYNKGIDAPGFDWIDISPQSPGLYAYINSIVVSPTDPNKIWITYSNIWHDNLFNNANVYQGTRDPITETWTWNNYSSGLPEAPTNRIICQAGTNNKLWVSVDGDELHSGGVYYRDGDMTTWEEFGSGLPHAIVTDIEIDYCTGKLGAATFGAGIWEVDLPVVENPVPLEISSNTTWSTNKDLVVDVVIKSGSTLTINNGAIINMAAKSRIIVERSAKLIVEDATITNLCGVMWQGIEVWGQGNAIPHPTIGSILGGSYPSGSADHGVVLLNENATIENARNGITTSKYDEVEHPELFRGGIIVAHGANFINCRRAVEFMQFDYAPNQIDDDNISEFYRCNFEVNENYPCEEELFAHVSMWDVDGVIFIANTFSDLRDDDCKNEARGIYSIDATYTVASVVCGGATPCDEEYGHFTGLYRGIQAENANYRPRDIVVSDIIFTNNYRGILLSNVDNSLVISNSFSVPDISEPSNNAYGIYFEDCSGYHVENNSFTTYGSYDDASPYNAGMYVVNNSNAQTEVYRNTFSDLEAGIRVQTNNSKLQIKCNTFSDVIAKHDIYVTNTGELGDQGKCLNSGFSNCERVASPAGNKFLNSWTNNTSDIKLFDGHPELKYKHHTGADYAPTWYTTGATTFVNPIPCSYPDNLGSCYACQSTLPEGGSGYRVSGEAEDQTAYALYQDLLAVKAQIQALEEELLTETEYVLEYDLEMLAESDELDYLSAKIETLLEKVANRYVLENKADSAISILEQEDLEWTSRRIVDIYLMIGDYTSASTALDLLPADGAENAEYKKLTQIQLTLFSDSLGWEDIDEDQKTVLLELAGKQTKSGVAAENILHFTEGTDFEEVFDPEELTPRMIDTELSETIQVYPNPATDELFINLQSSNETDAYTIRIFNVTGTKLYFAPLASNSLHTMDIANLPNGLLYIQILKNNAPAYIVKIVHL